MKRKIKHLIQWIKWGFSDEETWNLDYRIAKFTLPRLKRFKKTCNGYPYGLTEEKWDNILSEMILAFELIIKDCGEMVSNKDYEKINKGIKLFGEYFRDLWW